MIDDVDEGEYEILNGVMYLFYSVASLVHCG